MYTKEAIILVGGLGSRLKEVIPTLPKPLAPINGKPFLDYLLEFLSTNGFTKVILATGYKYETIQEHYSTAYKNMQIIYSNELMQLGTGGAIKQAIKHSKEKNIAIFNGDSFFTCNIENLFKQHVAKNADITIATKFLENIQRYGALKIINNRVHSFKEKEENSSGYINGGVYIIKSNIFNNIDTDIFSFETFLQQHVNNLYVSAQVSDSYFIDIGIPKDYQQAQIDFKGMF